VDVISALANTEQPLGRELAAACLIARAAGELAQRYFFAWHPSPRGEKAAAQGGNPGALVVEWKPGDEPVTAADRAVSELCVGSLRREFPADAVVSEELPDDGHRRQVARTWLIDPIDGTKDFIAGRHGYSVMIGLLVNDRPVLGAIFQPSSTAADDSAGRLFYATLGGGAFALRIETESNSLSQPRRLHVSPVAEIGEARMVSSSAGPAGAEPIGSIGVRLSLIAAGERDLYVNLTGHTKLWDSCAPNVILHEAGGRLTDLYGRPLDYSDKLSHGDGLVASNGLLHDQALAQLRPFAAGRAKASR
jgi:3'-phosphoadenosine 5'-phosphosulfate (PAPS) 3'-phosphatase